jgi:Flp pilus assembly protein TadG
MSTAARGRAAGRDGRSGGQTLVEFALVFPLFIAMLFGLIDVGRLVYQHSTLSQAAREAARTAAVEAYWIGESSTDTPSCNTTGGPKCPVDFNAFKADVVAAANRMVAPFATIATSKLWIACTTDSTEPTGSWTIDSCTDHTTKDVVSVRVEMTFTALTPIASGLVGPVVMSASASMIIN